METGNITLEARACAKINVHLAVKNRRPDGFHNLESVFLKMRFGDVLYFEAAAANGPLEIITKGAQAESLAGLPAEENIVFKAAASFRRESGYERLLRIRLEKRIPAGGGLGGGSSDAACALLALNELAARGSPGKLPPLSDSALAEIAASLGSDVPFFLSGAQSAWVSGRGEIVKPIAAPRGLFFALAGPGFPSPTAAAFRLLAESRLGKEPRAAEETERGFLAGALGRPPGEWPFWNDFLPAFLQEPQGEAYSNILRRLKAGGAQFAGLSGAGSTCFGVFTEKSKAEKACGELLNICKFAVVTEMDE